MNKVTEEEIKYDIDKTLQTSQFVNCARKSTISHPSSIMGTTEQIKMEGSFISVDRKAPPLLLLCSYSSSSNLLLLQRESSWFSCSVSGFLLLGKLAGYMLACTHLNVKESELLPYNYLGVSPHVSNSLYSLMEKGATLSWNLDIWARIGSSLAWCMSLWEAQGESETSSYQFGFQG